MIKLEASPCAVFKFCNCFLAESSASGVGAILTAGTVTMAHIRTMADILTMAAGAGTEDGDTEDGGGVVSQLYFILLWPAPVRAA